MTSGIVTLYDYNGEYMAYRKYHCLAVRESTIDMWKKSYGKLFFRMSIHIRPDTRDDLVDDMGRNCRRPPYMGVLLSVEQSKVVQLPTIKKPNRTVYKMLDG